MIKKLDKYSYGKYTQINDHGPRTYDVNGNRLPSVTTVLGQTKDKSFLNSWIARKGRKEAEEKETTYMKKTKNKKRKNNKSFP